MLKNKNMETFTYKNEDYKLIKTTNMYYSNSENSILGIGSRGCVYQGIIRKPDMPNTEHVRRVAIKIYQDQMSYDEKARHEFDEKIKIWLGLTIKITARNLNITILYDFHRSKDWWYIAMEVAERNLIKQLENLKYEDEHDAIRVGYLRNILEGIKFLHKEKIVHGNINPSSILIFDEKCANLGDFGPSRQVSSVTDTTTKFLPPECRSSTLNEEKISTDYSQDIFSFGATIYYTMTWMKHPTGDDMNNFSVSEDVLKAHCTDHVSATDIIEKMMSKDAKNRPDIDVVSKHPFFYGLDEKLQFIFKIAISLNSEDKAVIQEKIAMDQIFREENKNFNWRNIIGTVKFQQFCSRKGTRESYEKNYNITSLSSLLKLIRDKYVHYQDLPDELKNSFCEVDTIDKSKYISYFLKHFPMLMLFLHDSKFKKTSQQEIIIDNCSKEQITNNESFGDAPLKVVVKRPVDKMNFSSDEYRLPHGTKGVALVVNIIEFEQTNREGATNDTTYMTNLWYKLGYEVTTHEGFITRHDVFEILMDFKRELTSSKTSPNSCVVYIGSLGNCNAMYTSDMKEIYFYTDIVEEFTTLKCPSLNEKPKIFLFNTSQTFKNTNNCIDEYTDWRGEIDDCMLLFPTFFGGCSYRMVNTGTYYAYCLANVFMDNAWEMDLVGLLQLTRKTLINKCKSTKQIQRPAYVNLGMKSLYFNMWPKRKNQPKTKKPKYQYHASVSVKPENHETLKQLLLARLPRGSTCKVCSPFHFSMEEKETISSFRGLDNYD